MHAMEGAFTETQYIYQPTIEQAFRAVNQPAFISVGLGLGYNEILVICESLKQGKMPALIHSYESVEWLITGFTHWIQEIDNPLNPIYDEILAFYADKYALPISAIRFRLKDLLDQKKLVLDGAIHPQTQPPAVHAICFDAFSSKTSPELWTEEFLESFFRMASETPCFVSTYACTGALKRSLKKNGYVIEIKKGFGVKRESTFAVKNL